MDVIEASGVVPSSLGATLGAERRASASVRLDGTTPESLAKMDDLKKRELAKDFEALLVTQLFKEVKASVDASSFDEDPGSDQIHGMFWSFLAEDVADKGGFGLWQEFYEQFKGMEGASGAGELMDKEA